MVATPADLDPVTKTLALAFEEDPVWSWAFGVRARGPGALQAAWRFLIATAIDYGWVWHADNYAAASLWIPPGESEIKSEDEELFETLLSEQLGEEASRLFAIWECFERAHEIERLQHPYYYLSLLGTRPDQAGQGFGMGLLAANLRQLDALGSPAYLESTNRANDHRYERLGFEPCGKFELPEDGPDVVQMWRDPA